MAALETLFTIEEKFTNLMFINQIRHDPELGHRQLYLVNEITNENNKLCLSFLQALGDAANSKISWFMFLQREFRSTVACGGMLGCAIDERERLLYVLYAGMDYPAFFLNIYHLHYQPADNFGYRRIVVQDGRHLKIQTRLVCREPSPFELFPLDAVSSLSICPVTGRLVTGYMAFAGDLTNYQVAMIPADLVCSSQKVEVKAAIDRLPFMPKVKFDQLELHCFFFSRSNHLLLWQGFRTQASLQTPIHQDTNHTILKSFIPGHPENGHLNEMKIDPVKLVESFLPNAFDKLLTEYPYCMMPKHIFFGSQLLLLGDVRKYMVFAFRPNYVLAAKLPREWYRLPEIPAARVSKVLHVDREEKWGIITTLCLYGTDLYLKSKLGDSQIVRRMALGHKFKDYRRCAFCAKEESKKKRNKDGKRVSKFKVLDSKVKKASLFFRSVECAKS